MNNPYLEILIIFLLLLGNGVFAMAEIAVMSARKGRLQQMANEGDPRARVALTLAQDPNQFLSTVQVGITLVGILAGAFGGATLAENLAAVLSTVPGLPLDYAEAISVGLVVLGITYFSLIIGELVPKQIALTNAEKIASVMAGPMQTLARVAAPAVRVLTFSTDVLVRLLGVKPSTEPPITEEELKVLIEQGTQAGVFETTERTLLEGVLELGARRVNAVMVPRTQVVWLDVAEDPASVQHKVLTSRHTRFPVAQGSLDNLLGVVHVKDLLAQAMHGGPLQLQEILQAPLFIPENMPALQVLERFKEQRLHIALVTDEFGGIQGMVTHNDVMDEIVRYSALADPESDGPRLTPRADGSWLCDGLLPITHLKELLHADQLPDESSYQTVGGFVLNQLGVIPTAGQAFSWQGHRFEVVDMDRYRVDKVLITRETA